MSTALSSPSHRLHALDAVRGGALLLGVALHATLSFIPGAQVWLVADPSRSMTLAYVFFAIHVFRMTLFFILAGFFAHLLFHRLGLTEFVKNRFKRIFVPLVTFWPIVLPGIVAALVWAAHLKFGGLPKDAPPGPKFTPGDFPLTHLWFLWMLMLLYAALIPLRAVLVAADRRGWLRNIADRTVGFAFRPVGLLLIALPGAVVLWLEAKWTMWTGIPTPDRTLYANVPAWVCFGLAFGFGWLLDRRRDLLDALAMQWKRHALIAIVLLGGCFAAINVLPASKALPADGLKFAMALLYNATAWAMSLAAIALAVKFLSNESPTRRYIADASYWVYIIHLPIILALQVVWSQLTWAWWIKFPLIVGPGLVIMFASYHWLVRSTAIGAMLNGRKMPRKISETTTTMPQPHSAPT
ncbi:MAG: acyltransferase family protein [Betaproteobacteria bacterium]|nr:acyltransferase family protein [Betaproteobacteria bacterium]